MSTQPKNERTPWGCMLLVASPFIFLALILGFALFLNLYLWFFPEERSYPITTFSNAPEYSSQLMNPIRAPSPMPFQVESTGFKTVRMVRYGGTANSTPYLFVTDSNNYCYWIYGSSNELHPFFINAKTKEPAPSKNLVGEQDWPQVEYLLVTIGGNFSSLFKQTKSIEVQRQWLTNNAANKNPRTGTECVNAPRADIIKIRYRLGAKLYAYEVDPEQMQAFDAKLQYTFK